MGPTLGLVIYTDDNTPNLLDIVDVGPTLSRVIYTDDDTPNLLDVVDVGPTLGRVLYTDDKTPPTYLISLMWAPPWAVSSTHMTKLL